MSISSFNMQTSTANSIPHMKRDSYVSYLIDYSGNAFEYKNYLDSKEYLEYAKIQTKLLTKRNMQSSAIENFIQEAVINIEKYHTIKDIENLFKNLNNHFEGGFKLFDIAVHKDEGVFIDSIHNVNDLTFDSKTLKIYKDGIDVTNDVISFAPNKDVFYNPDNKKWYKERAFKNEFDTSKMQIKYNYHAHANFTRWEESTGKNVRLQKSDLQKIQDITAKSLQMQRGEKNSKVKRMNHYQIKTIYADNNELKKEQKKTLAKVKDLDKLVEDLRQELIASKNASKADYNELKQEKERLKELLKNKELTIDSLNEKIDDLRDKLLQKDEIIETLQNEKEEYKEQNEIRSKIIMETIEEFDIEGRRNLRNVINYFKNTINALKNQISSLFTENKNLKDEINTLKNQNKVLKSNETLLKDKIDELQEKNISRPNMSEFTQSEVEKRVSEFTNSLKSDELSQK